MTKSIIAFNHELKSWTIFLNEKLPHTTKWYKVGLGIKMENLIFRDQEWKCRYIRGAICLIYPTRNIGRKKKQEFTFFEAEAVRSGSLSTFRAGKIHQVELRTKVILI